MYQWPIFDRREGSIGTIFYFYFRIPGLFFFTFF
uniref:Ribosomal protein L22 n=1 Tax=Canavalia gladiata TaxID=3824 RepID=A0A7L7SFS1_CANGL|nr:ribosomal protein L22 [Canavalia gladiata]QNZ92634.1 ribosomal protein L22 [Canavalia gladiata]